MTKRNKRSTPLIALFILSLVFVLVACGEEAADPPPATAPPSTVAPVATVSDPAQPRPTVTPGGVDDPDAPGYPPSRPTVTPFPEGYQAVLAAPPTPDAYPAVAGFTWMIRAAGEQCSDGLDYPDLSAALKDLTGAGVMINAQTSVNLMVCEACGCPTSLHFRAQVADENVEAATGLGWEADKQ